MKRSTTQRRHGRKHGRNSKTRKMRGGGEKRKKEEEIRDFDVLMKEREDLEEEIANYIKNNPFSEGDINRLLGEEIEYFQKMGEQDAQGNDYGHLEQEIITLVTKLKKNEEEMEEYKRRLRSAPQRQSYGRYGSRPSSRSNSRSRSSSNSRGSSRSRSNSRSNSR